MAKGVSAGVWVAPALVVYALVVLLPLGQSVWYSFFDWNGITQARWLGVGNYANFLTDPLFRDALSHTLIFVFFYALVPIVLGLLSAALVSRRNTPGVGAFRSIIFLPQVLTSVVIAVMWKQIYGPDGAVNTALNSLGLSSLAHAWLGDFNLALPALGLVGTWTTMGLCMLLFIAGMGNIPEELYDAARVDGAGPIREFLSVTLPGLVPQIGVALTLTVVGALRTFDLVYLTTRGGPGTSTYTPALLLYSQAFTQQHVGAGAAIGVSLAAVSLAIALLIVRITDRTTS